MSLNFQKNSEMLDFLRALQYTNLCSYHEKTVMRRSIRKRA